METTDVKKLNYLLVMPRYVSQIGDWYQFSLGLAYISASMKAAGHRVTCLNLNHRAGNVRDILRDELAAHAIDVVATGGLSSQYSSLRIVVESVKQLAPQVTTIVGGGIISSDPETAMAALEHVDYGVIGEGEDTIRELCAALESGGDPAAVNGLVFRRAGRLLTTPPRREIADIDTIPWPDYEGFEFEKLMAMSPSIIGANEKNTVIMLTSRSCPYRCTFCFHTVGRKYRQRSLDGFFAELDFMVRRYGVKYLLLADELFGYNLERVREFCARIKPYGIPWWGQFRVDDVSQELLDTISDGGCAIMGFGLESADNRILKSMRKHTTIEQVDRALELVSRSGLAFYGLFIFGDREETRETAETTLTWWRNHKEYDINLSFIIAYPGTHLYRYACEKGIITDKVQFLRDGCPHVNLSKMSPADITWLAQQLIELPRSLCPEPEHPRFGGLDYAMVRADIGGRCVKCGAANEWQKIKLFVRNHLICAACGRKHSVPCPPAFKRSIEANLRALIDRGEQFAVWGITEYAYDFIRLSGVFNHENVHLVDSSKLKQGVAVQGRTIEDPAVIRELGLRTVVVSTPIYYQGIREQIRSDFPGVATIASIYELVKPPA